MDRLQQFYTFRPRAAKYARTYGNAGVVFWCETASPMAAFKGSFVPSFHANMAKAIDDNLAENIAVNVANRLLSRYRITSPSVRVRSNRLKYLANTIISKQDRKVYSSKASYQVGVGNISMLDRKMQISTLDRRLPLRHNAEGYPKKAKAETGILYHLWRILEIPRASSYRIAATGFGKKKKRGRPAKVVNIRSKSGKMLPQKQEKATAYLRFTTTKDVWRSAVAVQWKAKKSPSSSAYWFLDARRELYRADKDVFFKHVVKAIETTIVKSPHFSR